MSRSKDPKLIFNSRNIIRNQGQGSGKDETQVKGLNSINYECHSSILASDHTKLTSFDTTDEGRRLTSQDIADISRMSNPKDLSGTFEAADKLDAEGKNYAYEDISPGKSSHSSTISMEDGDENKSRNKTSQIANNTVKTRNETDDSKIVGMKKGKVFGCTGMSGGKAVSSTVIGEEVTSRNNTSHIEDSVVKVKNETGGSEIVGLEGGESYESTIIGKKSVFEGNKQTVERSHVDIEGDPSAALQPLLLKAGSGNGGDGGVGVSIYDTTIIINGTGGQSDDISNDQKEFADTTEDLKQDNCDIKRDVKELQHTMGRMKQEDVETKRRVTGLEQTGLETNGRVKKLADAFEKLKQEKEDMKHEETRLKNTLSCTVDETKELRDTVQAFKKTVSDKSRRIIELVNTIEEIKEQDSGIKHSLNVLTDMVEGLKVKDVDVDRKVNELEQNDSDTNLRVNKIEDTLYRMEEKKLADKTELTDEVTCMRQELEDTKRQFTELLGVVDAMMNKNTSTVSGIGDFASAVTAVGETVCSTTAVASIGGAAITAAVGAPAVVGAAAVATLGCMYAKFQKLW